MSENGYDNSELEVNRSPIEQGSVPREFTVAKFESLAGQILEKHIKGAEDTDFRVDSVQKTSKSVYGEVWTRGERRYYKLSSAKNIGKELLGYKVAKDLPHKEIVGHHFDDDGVYGLYLQEYCEDLDNEAGLLLCAINHELLTHDQGQIDSMIKRLDAIFESLHKVFNDSLNTEPYILDGANDQFFSSRLLPGARFDGIYSGSSFKFSSSNEEISTNELFNFQISTNGHFASKSINELIADAREKLDPKKPRVFVISQGDLLESNLTINGTFFDFETAGINALSQEMAVFLCGIYFGGHYIYAKYSPLDSSYRTGDVYEFEKSVSAKCQLEKDKKQFNVDLNFPFPPIKKALIENYLIRVIEPLEKRLPEELSLKLFEELRSAILVRILAVKKIPKFDEKDQLFSLGLVAHFFEDSKQYTKMSDFIRDKFVSIE